jgi:hypothetical protein
MRAPIAAVSQAVGATARDAAAMLGPIAPRAAAATLAPGGDAAATARWGAADGGLLRHGVCRRDCWRRATADDGYAAAMVIESGDIVG